MRPEILKLKPGTRVVSNSFRMGDWDPDETSELGCSTCCSAFLWLVPAQFEGEWKLAQGVLQLNQTYQKLGGTLKTGNVMVPIAAGSLRGDEISFSAGIAEYRGKVAKGEIKGTLTCAAKTAACSARR